ncbi:hypothetical protein [Anaerorhabdus furcosa]|uniref:Type IV pilus assembly protein PilM n=1 Tax=Anaerorhabdus furcosa TaxID=118967 RepID=A0A1T4MJW8_9FIRM|nr:hypothetical protein [Anaerorhabdus furcosa]SJZ67329.1 hypothetical protein SAMN02745191_1288 [Anaerorhabdus furcosa]
MAYYIEIGNTQYKIVDATFKKNQIKIDSFKTVYSLMDQDNLHQIVTELQDKKVKKATVIANNTSAFYRELKVPVLDDNKTVQIIRNELQASQTINQDMLIDFVDIGLSKEENLRKILVCGLPVSLVGSYEKLLKDVKCKKARTIEVGNRALFNYLSNTSIKDNTQPYITLEIINGLLKVFLFDEQKFVLLRSARISFDDYEGLVSTIKEEISLMQQFQLTRHYQSKIEAVYLFGDYNGINKLISDLSLTVPMQIAVLPALSNLEAPEDFNYLSYIHVLGSLVGNPKNLNFDKLYDEFQKDAKAMDPNKKKLLITSIVAGVVLVGVYGGLFYLNETLKKDIEAEKTFTTNEELLTKVAKVLEEESMINAYATIGTEIDGAQANLDLIPYVNQYVMDVIYGYEGASVQDFSLEQGIFSIVVQTTDSHIPTYFADHLRNSGIFESVDFYGMQYSDKDNNYTFNVIATMERSE